MPTSGLSRSMNSHGAVPTPSGEAGKVPVCTWPNLLFFLLNSLKSAKIEFNGAKQKLSAPHDDALRGQNMPVRIWPNPLLSH
jgi:hypothetical protein